MTVVQINVSDFGSTGAIVRQIRDSALAEGSSVHCFFGRVSGKVPDEKRVGNIISTLFHVFLARIGLNGHGSYFATKKLCRELEEIAPDVVILHNVHGYYIHLKTLFDALAKTEKTEIYWFMHDAWAFTGRCAYFSAVNCEQWKDPETAAKSERCSSCPYGHRKYPRSLFDTAAREFAYKKEIFTALPVERTVLVSPSEWLKSEISQSFLAKYRCTVRKNTPDTSVFYRRSENEIKEAAELYGIPGGKPVVMSVAMVWDERKQLPLVVEIARRLPGYTVVAVGLNKKQLRMYSRKKDKGAVPDNFIPLGRTSSAAGLASLYSLAAVLVNPSLEDNYPMVPLEAQACGTPVVSSNTCGSPETVINGIVVDDARDPDSYIKAIKKLTGGTTE
ncbi:MAG: glycosyltransferase [Clostridia bacterium]|nr:glycosyltransferase [Clostridia bacterium]